MKQNQMQNYIEYFDKYVRKKTWDIGHKQRKKMMAIDTELPNRKYSCGKQNEISEMLTIIKRGTKFHKC